MSLVHSLKSVLGADSSGSVSSDVSGHISDDGLPHLVHPSLVGGTSSVLTVSEPTVELSP